MARKAASKTTSKTSGKTAQKISQKKAALLAALEKSLGVVTTACRKAGVKRSTFYNYVSSDPEFAEAVHEIDEISLDFAESALFKLIAEGNVPSVIFFLKTRGKRRGYTERNEIEHTGRDGVFKVEIVDDLSALSGEELRSLKTIQSKLESSAGSGGK